MSAIPRGIRNNNPGNIDYNPRNRWLGQLAPDPAIEKRFARFDTPENGIRAIAKLILAYRGKDGQADVGHAGIDTVQEIISRWAPGIENDTDAYVAAVAAALRVSPHAPLDVRSPPVLTGLVASIIRHENGDVHYPAGTIEAGVKRALG